MMNFYRKTIVITGAAQGIGKELVKSYAEAGGIILAIDHQAEKLKSFVQELRVKGLDVTGYVCDLSSVESIQQLFEQLQKTTKEIHILINNAGIGIFKDPLELSIEEWDDVIHTNLRGSFLMSKYIVPFMKEAGGGAIVNMSSTRALMSEQHSESYAASKGGILALSHALSVSLGKYGITVNSISPGWIETGLYEELKQSDHEQHPAKRVGKPSDIVRACMYLTDEFNNFVTGTNLVVDGGMTKKMIYEE